MKKELKLNGVVTWLQMVSLRNKTTNTLKFSMDGNVNNTLHTLYNNLESVEKFYWVIPKISKKDKEWLDDINDKFFKNKIKPIQIDYLYGENAIEHKDNFYNHLKDGKEFTNDFLHNRLDKSNIIVCDFPCDLSAYDSNSLIKYNWSISKKSNDDISKGTKYFEYEIELLKNNKCSVYYFSDEQLEYTLSKENLTNCYRRVKVFNRSFHSKISTHYLTNNKPNKNTLEIIHALEQYSGDIILWSYRMDDPRYKINGFLKSDIHKRYKNPLILFTNPTNVTPDTNTISDIFNEIMSLVKNRFVNAIICNFTKDVESYVDIRYIYFYITKLLKNLHIEHWESDFHTSTAEHWIEIGTNRIILNNKKINENIVESYIY